MYQTNNVIRYGLVQTVLRSSHHADHLFFIVRCMQESPSDVGNRLVTEKCGHKRFQYVVHGTNEVYLDLVPVRNVLYPAFVVFDWCQVAKQFGIHYTGVHRFETTNTRLASQFFKVGGVRLSPFRESTE